MTLLVLGLVLATTPTQTVKRVPCAVVQSYIWLYGEAAVIGWARSQGYSELMIADTIRRCKKG